MSTNEQPDFLAWLDTQDVEDQPTPGWVCDTLGKAERAALRYRKLADLIAEVEQTKERMIREATDYAEEARKHYEDMAAPFENDLRTYLLIQHEDTGRKTVRLPWGVTVSARAQSAKLVFEDDFLESNTVPEELVKTTRKLQVSKAREFYKDKLTAAVDESSGKKVFVDKESGAVLSGVSMSPASETVTVKVTG